MPITRLTYTKSPTKSILVSEAEEWLLGEALWTRRLGEMSTELLNILQMLYRGHK